nr:rodlin [Streptomyces mashuensis]
MFTSAIAKGALAVTAIGLMAAPATAAENNRRDIVNGNGTVSEHGATHTGGKESPQMTAVQGSLDKLCIGVGKAGIQSLALLLNIGVQDIPVLTSQQQQQCTDNSVVADGDDPLAHLLNDIPVISGNGSANG